MKTTNGEHSSANGAAAAAATAAELDLTRGPDSVAAEDPRLLAAVKEYMAEVDAGRRPGRREFLARHPEIAEELSICLQGLAFVQSAAAQMDAAASPANGENSGGAGAGGAQAPPAVGDEPADARPLGDFKLVREIGRGGMGVVYEATQLSLGRRVAVKVLSFAAALDPRHLQRFRNEAQAAAQLHHTNIVPVYAVGCERGVHFYAMQLIEGQSLSDVIRELRRGSGNLPQPKETSVDRPVGSVEWHPSTEQVQAPAAPAGGSSSLKNGNRITSKERFAALTSAPPAESLSTLREHNKRLTYFQAVARLGLQAAEALDYAHQMGVVHRDIKPANLMLDTRGNLWITDFGLAQFYAADTGLTQTGDLLGTFRYMSPEQASGRAVVLDQRTDIYSLGVTLYELLTLERALPGTTREQLLHQIGSVDPKPLRAIDRTIPAELDTIIFKAIAKDPADRYPSARAFAEDLGRFLRDEPIHARPPSAWDLTVKWTRRHKSLALSGLLMLAVIAAGLLTTTLLIAREQKKTEKAYVLERDKAIEADQQRQLADQSFREARDAVDFFTRVAAQEMANKPEVADLRKELLESSLAYYQTFLDQRRDDPSISAELTRARSNVSAILTELSAMDDFFRTMTRARLLARQASVQEALQVPREQAEDLHRFTDGMWRAFGSTVRDSHISSQQKSDKLAALADSVESKLRAMLTSEQYHRLQQIFWQVTGPLAFSDPVLVDALLLTREQKDQIQAIQSDYKDVIFRRGGPAGDMRRGGGGRPNDRARPGESRAAAAEERAKQMKEDAAVRDRAVERIVNDVLTSMQTEIWQSMIGEPFNGTLVPDRPPTPPPVEK